MRRLPKHFISWSKLAPKVFESIYKCKYPYSDKESNKEALQIGKERHQMIQEVVEGYAEMTPITLYYDKVLMGHVDIVDINDDGEVYIYEIKSEGFYTKYSKLVECQLSFYTYITKRFFETNNIPHKIINPRLILYYKDGWKVVKPKFNLEKLEDIWKEALKEVE